MSATINPYTFRNYYIMNNLNNRINTLIEIEPIE